MRRLAPARVLRTQKHDQGRSDWGIELTSDPLANVRRPRETGKRERIVTPEEEQQLYEGCVTSRNQLLLSVGLPASSNRITKID